MAGVPGCVPGRTCAGGQDRYRSLLQACINVWQERHDLDPIRLKAVPFDNQRIRFLSHAERDRLIGLYAKHVQPIATMFAFQGPRTQEALQLPWGQGASTCHAARSSLPGPRRAIRVRWRCIRGSRRWCGRSGKSAGGLTRVAVETLALVIRFWLTTTPALPESVAKAARAQAGTRYDNFVAALGRRLNQGPKLWQEIPEEVELGSSGDNRQHDRDHPSGDA